MNRQMLLVYPKSKVHFYGVLALCMSLVKPGSVHSQGYNSVLITEIMADPTPVVGLPDAEYLELFNTTSQPVSLKGWRIGIGNTVSVLPDSVIAPGGWLVLCSRARVDLLSPLTRVLGLASFSLTNAGTTLTLRNSHGTLIHSVAYRNTWWTADKRSGGYALEMVDTTNPCGETDNWKVSAASTGGTPGRANSVKGSNPDLLAPRAERAEISSNNLINIYFNERLDSLASVQSGSYELKGRSVQKISIDTPGFRVISLLLDSPLVTGQRYELTLNRVTDCAGNVMKEAKFALGLPVEADSGDVVLNEILYDPRSGGVEFVEIYNRTSNYISLKNWAIGNVRNGQPSTFRVLSSSELLLAPNGYLALSSDSKTLMEQYPTERIRTLFEVEAMPTYTNGSGGVALRNDKGQLFDLFNYDDQYHSPLLTDTKGVSLERMYPERSGNDPKNWQSAASLVGYATPGYVNSQGMGGGPVDEVTVEPEAITPNGDGVDDVATIRYRVPGPGRIANVRIYDVQGRLIRSLLTNQTVGTDGTILWDGTDDQATMVRTGYYLLLIDSFDSAGNEQKFKKRVVVVQP